MFIWKHKPETILHLFVDCETVKEFWQSLQIWLLQNIKIRINMDTKCILFSYQGKSKLGNCNLQLNTLHLQEYISDNQ